MTAVDHSLPHRMATWRSLTSVYAGLGRIAVLQSIQYRVSLFVMMLALMTEPLVYLVVWRTVASESGGDVDGFTPARFAAYYIVWGFVRQALMISGFGWEQEIRSGDLSRWLVRPTHPINDPLAASPAWGLMLGILYLPVGAVLTLIFRPELDTSPVQLVVFVVALLLAQVVSVLIAAVVGMTAFWLTRTRALDRLVWTATLLLAGRLVPVELLPGWARAISSVLWLRWIWDFPITALIGPVDGADLAIGLGMQVVWIVLAALAVHVIWRKGVRRYGAVGG